MFHTYRADMDSSDSSDSDSDSDDGEAKTEQVLMPPGHYWWRLMSKTVKATIDDRIAASEHAPTHNPVDLDGNEVRKRGGWTWGQWESAAITFAGVAESDSSGLATATAKRNPLSFADCHALAAACKTTCPGTVCVDIPLPHADRQACVVYIPQFFNQGDLSQDEMVEEMRRLKPKFIDRHSQNRGPTKTMHKNKRWNTNIVDKIHARRAGLYALDKKLAEAAQLKYATSGNPKDKYIPKLTSSEVPFAQLTAFQRARDKISALGEAVLPDEDRPPFGNQKRNLTHLNCELNFYFGPPCEPGGIGFHGDAERNLVFGGSIGTENRIIEWCRFHKDKPYQDPVSGKFEVFRFTLRPGDAYIMSEWAAGITWRTEAKSKVTIRHRAGSEAFLTSASQHISMGNKVKKPAHADHGFNITDYT